MIKFEVGCIYKANGKDSFIKITGRTESGFVSFVHLRSTGEEYSLGFKRKKVRKKWLREEVESLFLDVGVLGQYYYADDFISQEDWDFQVQLERENQEARNKTIERQKKELVDGQVARVKEVLEKYNLTYSQMDEIVDAYMGCNSDAHRILESEIPNLILEAKDAN